MKTVRLKQLEQWVAEQEFVSIEEICHRFNIHVNTARADVNELVRTGVAQKRYGGVARVNTSLPTTFVQRDQTGKNAKEVIGHKAAMLLKEGDVVFVDSGTTTAQMFVDGRALPEHLTVITNNLHVINWVIKNTQYTCFVLPGKADRQLNSIASLETIDSIRNYNIQKAFIGCRKIAPNGALTSASSIDAKIKETVIAKSQQAYLLADGEKIGAPELYSFANISQFNCWVCDVLAGQPGELAQKYNIILG